MNIFINGIAAKSAGGRSIYTNLLKTLNQKEFFHSVRFFVLVPRNEEFFKIDNDRIKIIRLGNTFHKLVMLPITYYLMINRLLRKYKIDIVLNLADIIIPSKIPQILLFDWPYAIYPKSSVWKQMNFFEKAYRKVKLFHFKLNISRVKIIFAQTKAAKKRLVHFYKIDQTRIKILPNALSLDHYNLNDKKDFSLPPEKKKLLLLSRYYVHKNFEILIPLAKKILLNNENICFVITISGDESKDAKIFLERIKNEKLNDFIINVGSVNMKYIPSLFSQCDALFLPTLLESFSGTYVEALFHKKIIITSNYDFAVDVCQECAYYFDPLDPSSANDAINRAFENEEISLEIVKNGFKILSSFPTWENNFDTIMNAILEINKNEQNNLH